MDLWAALTVLKAERERDLFHASDWNDAGLWSPRARQALSQVKRAAHRGADLYAPCPDGVPMETSVNHRPEAVLAEAPMEWALSHHQWTAAQALLDVGVDANRTGEVPVCWTRGKADILGQGQRFEQVRCCVPYAARAMIAMMELVNRPNGLVPDVAWSVLDTMAERGGRFDWADSTGSSVGLQVVSAWRRPEHLSNAWWSRLNPGRCDQWGRNLLHYWPYATDKTSLFGRLIDLGADPYHEDHHGYSPLLMMATITPVEVRDDVIRRLIATHPDLLWHAPTRTGESPLGVLEATPGGQRGPAFDALVQTLRAHAVAGERQVLTRTLDQGRAAPDHNEAITDDPEARERLKRCRPRL